MFFKPAFESVIQPAPGIADIDHSLMVIILEVCTFYFFVNAHNRYPGYANTKMLNYFLTIQPLPYACGI
jgi:hypothetical protein